MPATSNFANDIIESLVSGCLDVLLLINILCFYLAGVSGRNVVLVTSGSSQRIKS